MQYGSLKAVHSKLLVNVSMITEEHTGWGRYYSGGHVRTRFGTMPDSSRGVV